MKSLILSVDDQLLRLGTTPRVIPEYGASVDALLSASPSGNYKTVFSSFSASGSSVVGGAYNPNLWGGGGAELDFSGISWTVSTGFAGGWCVAITPRHCIICQHAPPTNGTVLQYVTQDGDAVDRTIIDVESNIGVGDVLSTFFIAYLDSDLPESVPRYPVMADNLTDMLGAPLIKLDQEKKALIADVMAFYDTLEGAPPESDLRQTYYESSISGDSGSPVFFLVGTQLIYATSLVGGGGGSGPNAARFLPQILAACDALDERNDSTGYAPTLFEG